MCGFTGIINFSPNNKVSEQVLKRMNTTIAHRGPDEESYYIKDNIGLGFQRLSIIDLEQGKQPMTDSEKKFWIVFNGEIYNYQNLKNELIADGYKFTTNSDTEVIINCYKKYGQECVQKLRGMFAFILWDSINNAVFMARDRFGIKPLFYLVHNEGIVFASELKALLNSGFSKKEINIKALDSFFTYNYILSPYTIYQDIHKLSAAHTLFIDLNQTNKILTPKKYWHPTFAPDYSLDFNDYTSMIDQKLKETVNNHLVSDVPVGAFLSGGIDSNSVVSKMTQLYRSQVKTFTIGFEENNFDESSLASISAKKFNTNHHELIINKNSALELEKIIDMYGEPFGDSSAIPTYFVSKLAANHVKVVLSGDGGDEFFGGYDLYRRLLKMKNFNIPSFIRYPLFRGLSKILPERLPGKRFSYILSQNPDYSYAYFNNMWYDEKAKVFNQDILNQIRKDPIQKVKIEHIKNSSTTEYLSKMMELDILTYLTDDILTKVDRASMANSLEVRVPIIDHEFFEVAMKIPGKYKIKEETGKYIFREAMRKNLPEEIYTQKKRGFAIPIYEWFKSDLNDFMKDSINTGNTLTEYFQPNYLNKIKNTKNLGSLISRVWPIIVFNTWLNKIHK